MKIRTDFVTNSSSSSFVTIHIKNDMIEDFLAKHGMDDLLTKLESNWAEDTIGVDLTRSFSESFSQLLTTYLDNPMFELEGEEEEAIDELIDILKENQDTIDASTEGYIDMRESCGEDGYGYYQRLCYQRSQGELTKWPSEDGESYDESFHERLFSGNIPELDDLESDLIYDIVLDDQMLKTAVEATGKATSFPLAQKSDLPEMAPEGTGWIKKQIFVLTGLTEEDEDEVVEVIEENGGEVKSSTVLKTNYVIYNPAYGKETKKMKRAQELIQQGKPITLLTKQQFWQRIGPQNKTTSTPAAVSTTSAECEKLFDGYAPPGEGIYYIRDLKKKTANICIPGTVDGLPVYVEQGAFQEEKKIESIIFSEGVIGVGAEVGSDCKNLKSVSFSSTMRNFSYGIFYGTPWKKSVGDWLIVNHILLAYQGNDPVVVIPDGVEEIIEYAFLGCSMEKVVIPRTVKKIGYSAFSHCSNLNEIEIPETITQFGNNLFDGTPLEENQDGWLIVNGVLCGIGDNYRNGDILNSNPVICLPEGIRSITGKLFDPLEIQEFNHVTEVILPEGLEEIGESVFSNFKGLQKINFPATLKKIGSRAFYECSSLSPLQFPESLKEIGECAFVGCRAMEEIELPDSVTVLGEMAFSSGWESECDKLETV